MKIPHTPHFEWFTIQHDTYTNINNKLHVHEPEIITNKKIKINFLFSTA